MLHTDIWSVVVLHLDYTSLLCMEAVSKTVSVLCERGWEERLLEKTGRRVRNPKDVYKKTLRTGYPKVLLPPYIGPFHQHVFDMGDIVRLHVGGIDPYLVVVNVFDECWLADSTNSRYIGLAEDALITCKWDKLTVLLLYQRRATLTTATLEDGIVEEIVVADDVDELLFLSPSKLAYRGKGNVISRTYNDNRLETMDSVIARTYNYFSWFGRLFVSDVCKWFHTDRCTYNVSRGDGWCVVNDYVCLLEGRELYIVCANCSLNKSLCCKDPFNRCHKDEFVRLIANNVVWARTTHENRHVAYISSQL